MKGLSKLLISAMVLATVVCACSKQWDEPEFTAPVYTGPAANKTIQDIINVYASAGRLDSICHATDTFVVKAVVVSSDEGGNFYKTMVVQDETGALQIQINKSGLYADYPVGQTVYIKCNGLVVGNYHGIYQIGWIYEGSVGRIDGHFLDRYLFKDGLPTEVTPLEITSPAGINSGNVCRLVRIKNCEFAADAIGKPWSEDAATTSRIVSKINDAEVTDFVVRTSNYAKFRKQLVPGGKGDLIGILTVYNNTYQFMLRDINDVQSFGEMTDVYPISFSNGIGNWTVNAGWTYYSPQQMMLHQNISGQSDDFVTSDWAVFNQTIPYATVAGSEMTIEHSINVISGIYDPYQICRVQYTTDLTNAPEDCVWHDFTMGPNGYLTNPTAITLTGLENIGSDFRIRILYEVTGNSDIQWGIKGFHFTKLTANN